MIPQATTTAMAACLSLMAMPLLHHPFPSLVSPPPHQRRPFPVLPSTAYVCCAVADAPSSSTTLSNYLYLDVSGSAALASPSRPKVKSSLVLGSKGGSFRITRLFSEFNRAVNFHCLKLPIWFTSLRLDSDNGAVDDGYGDSGTRDEGHLNGVVAANPKKVLILMTDTGSGHRASAEAIKAAFYEEFEDEYQVSCCCLVWR